jgi:hypothetical protein
VVKPRNSIVSSNEIDKRSPPGGCWEDLKTLSAKTDFEGNFINYFKDEACEINHPRTRSNGSRVAPSDAQ